MNRREFLQCAAILVSGVSASQLGFTLSEEQLVLLANAPNFNTTSIDYFSAAQREIVAALAETIIPRTEAPGAIDARVPVFLELMVANWLNEEERAIFDAGLNDIETRIPVEYGKPYPQLSAQQQLQILEALEDAASDSPWYDFGNVQREYLSDAPFICQLKELTIWGFFTSEVGGSQVLRYNPMPMFFDGDIPLASDDSSWAAHFLM
jgi:gluconate 2-dehydrogenase gamma chain